MSETIHHGGCLCGAVRYEAAGDGFHATICHCRSCRLATGSPVVAWVTFPSAGFRFTRTPPVEHRSSPTVTRTFCGRCGTTLTYRHDAHADEIDVTIATLDDPEAFAPADHCFVGEKIGWMSVNDGRECFERTRPGWSTDGASG